MHPAGLLILAGCAILETRCASIGDKSGHQRERQQESAASWLSRFRQLNSIEPFLQERARLLASRQNSAQDSAAALGNNLNESDKTGARQLAYSYVQPAGAVPLQPASGYNYAPNNVHGRQPWPQAYYNQATSQAHRPQAIIRLATEPQQQADVQSHQAYAPAPGSGPASASASGGASEPTRVIYGQADGKQARPAASTTTASLQYAAHLPNLQEVIELAEPKIKSFATKRGARNSKKTVVSFRLARRIRVPLDPDKVMQPEFYLQEDPLSYEPAKKHAGTTATPEAPGEAEAKESADEDEAGEQANKADEAEREAGENKQGEEQMNSDESNAEVATATTTTTADSAEPANTNSHPEVDAQQATQEAEDEIKGALKLKEGELERLNDLAAKKKPESEDRDKTLNDFGKDKLDKAGNFLEFGEKHASKLAHKIGLEHKTPDEAQDERGRAPDTSGLQQSEQKMTGNEQLVLGANTPPIEVALGEVDAKAADEAAPEDDGT